MEKNEQHDFCHLHNHSYYSLLDGLSSIKDLVQTASDLNYKSLALTDHGSCAGLYQFQKVCKKFSIKPILGMEGYICPDLTIKEKDKTHFNHIVLLAKNKIGYKNLIYLSSYAYSHGFYYRPRIDFDLLSKHHEGLIVSSACVSGEIPWMLWNDNEAGAIELAGKYKELLGDDFYIEIMSHEYDKGNPQQEKEKKLAGMLYKLAKKMDIKAICTQDTHYARREDWEAHDVLLSIQTLNHIKNPNRLTMSSKDFYLKPYEQMKDLYKKAPELLLNTVEIAEKIESNLISTSEDLLPEFKLPVGFETGEDYLKELVRNGMVEKGLIDKKVYKDRIKYEMSVIIKCKYTKYFLILWDIINFARVNSIRVGVGRGSAVSSLCLYVLGVTKLDPLKYDLIFERFLNPDRISPPDVDVDFDYFRREEVCNYIVQKYGADYCSQIATYNAFKARGAIRSTAKALDIGNDWETYLEKKKKNPDAKIEMTKKTLDLADRIAKQIPFKPVKTIEETLRTSSDFRDSMHKYPNLLRCALQIEGTLSSAGVHPAGIIVCKNPIVEHVPQRSSKGVICSQYTGTEDEELGLLKFDLLALKTLTVIDRSLKMIKENYPDKLPKDFDIDKLEPNDPNVFGLFNGTDSTRTTAGIFQFESDGITELLHAIRVDRFEDLIVANALYRPGPLGADVDDMYCDYKHGKKKIEYLHPKMGDVLNDTYGIMIFQENIMKVAQVIAGFTGGQADTLRKAVGKKDADLLKQQKDLFIRGCIKNGVQDDIAEKIFAQIDFFAGYGFNKSHSAAYAYLAYQTAWLKYYYPLEFMCNLLTSEIGNEDKLNMYLGQAVRMKIGCAKEDINRSGLAFKISKIETASKKVVMGLIKPLTGLKGVGAKAVQNIVENQPYKNIEEFLRKIDSRVVNVRVFKTLVEAGCMDSWNTSGADLLIQHENAKKKLDKERKEKRKQDKKMAEIGGGTLFDDFDYSGENLNI